MPVEGIVAQKKNISRKWNVSIRGNEILQRKGASLRDPAILEDESAPQSRMQPVLTRRNWGEVHKRNLHEIRLPNHALRV